jgi:hypothetical protein
LSERKEARIGFLKKENKGDKKKRKKRGLSPFLTAFSVFMYFLLLRCDEVIIIASPLEQQSSR